MDENDKAAELAIEQEAQQKLKEEDVRAKVIEEYGFDSETDAERIEKLTKREMEQHQKLFGAVGAKIRQRQEAEELRKKLGTTLTETTPKAETSDVSKVVAEQLAQRDLEEMSYSDKTKEEIAKWAKYQNISIKQAAKASHIALMIEEDAKAETAQEAAISRNHRSSGSSKFDINNPPDVDMRTEEGQKVYDAWKARAKKEGF